MLPGEHLFAYLDDVYVLCKPDRVRVLYELLKSTLKEDTGLDLNEGKTRVYNKGGVKPEGVEELGPQVWAGALDKNAAERGLKVLGTPVGTPEFVAAHGKKWAEKEKQLWELLPKLPDLQSAWLLLLQCAGPRFNYRSRTVPPQENLDYAASHDKGMWSTLCALLGKENLNAEEASKAEGLATLPLRSGGLGLRSAVRTGPAAYWASWADTLPMMAARCPTLAEKLLLELEKEDSRVASTQAATEAKQRLLAEGYHDCPSWREVYHGKRPPEPKERAEPGEFRHGWQYHAASRRETHYREARVMPSRDRASQALVRSQAGRCAGEHLTLLPLNEELRWTNTKLRALLLRRLRQPLDLDWRKCKCGQPLDALGDHRAACSTVGVLAARAVPPERAWARVGREAGGRVKTNVYLKNLNLLEARVRDDRRLEVVVSGLPLYNGAQVAVDATLVSPLTRKGQARARAHWQDGAALKDARKSKANTYPELLHSSRCRLLTAGMEVGGRWDEEAYNFLVELAKAKAAEAPKVLRGSAVYSWLRRWVAILSKAGMDSFVTILLGEQEGGTDTDLWYSPVPPLGAVVCAAPEAPLYSRLGP